MKISEVVRNSSVSEDDVKSICRDLGIKISADDGEISDKDSVYVKTRIESLKEERAKQAEQKLSGAKKKIRLKQKVDISSHLSKDEAAQNSPKDDSADSGEASIEVDSSDKKISHREESAPVQADRPPVQNQNRPYGDRPPVQNQSRPYGDRPQGQSRPYGDRPQGQNRPYGDRPQGQSRPYGDRPQGQSRPYGDRPQGQNRPYGDRPQGQNRPYGDRPQGQNRPYGNRPQGQGGFNRGGGSFGNRGPRPGGGFGAGKPQTEGFSTELEQNKGIDRGKRKERDKEKDNKKSRFAELSEKEAAEKAFLAKKKKEQRDAEISIPKNIEITETISVGDLSKKLNVKASDVIAKLMKLGFMATINQVLDAETAEILSSEYGTQVKVVTLYEETVIREEEEDREDDNVHRPPIVTVMGHVDHGKTKLLDAIRSSNVIDKEFGGITQHIGAYQVDVHGQKVTFFDTPGHAAFTTMRARGAKVTDIVILIVAANDGVMPQTVEAINHAKDANVPIIVAINKIDLPEANPQKVREALTAYEIVPEEWGGKNLFVEISAKQKINIEGLLEAVLMQSEILDLKANAKIRAKGTIIESKIEHGRGTVCTVLIQNGSLRVGDFIVAGVYSAKVRAMFNDLGEPIEVAGPSTPVEILGIDGIPSAGDPFQAVVSDKYAKQIGQKRQELKRAESAKQVKKVTLESFNEMIKDGEVQDLKVLIKADVDGSVQALKDALEKLSTNEVRVKVIHAAAGGINESDVMLASASNAVIIGYHVRPLPKIADLAEAEKVSIKMYNIIFEVTDDVKKAMEGMLAPDIIETITGHAEVRQTFKVSKVGTIAGCILTDGKIQKTNKVRLVREAVVVFDGELKSLKRYKDDVNEVLGGQECGLGLTNYNDVRVGDTLEFYKLTEVAKKLGG